MPTSHDDEARRRYWTPYMDRMDELTEQMLAYPIEDCGEELGSIRDAMDAAGAEVAFSDTLIDDELERLFYLREGSLPHLVAADQDHAVVLRILLHTITESLHHLAATDRCE